MSDGHDTVASERPEKLVALNGEKGLYVIGEIEKQPVKFLIDTGASISLISTSLFEKLQEVRKFEQYEYDVYQADGQKMEIWGKLEAEITMGPLRVMHELVIADLQVDAILGMDYLTENECKLDLAQQLLTVQGTIVNLWSQKTGPRCCKVSVKSNIIIPGNHEKIIEGIVQKRGSENNLNVLEGTQKFTEKYGLLVGKSLVDISKGQVLIRILNLSEKEVELHAGTIAALCQSVDSVAPGEMDTDQWVRNIGINGRKGNLEGRVQEDGGNNNTEQQTYEENEEQN